MANLELATAYVSLVPTTVGFKKNMETELRGVEAFAAAYGQRAGKDYSRSFYQQIVRIVNDINGVLDFSSKAGKIVVSGTSAGRKFYEGYKLGVAPLKDTTKDSLGNAPAAAGAAGEQAGGKFAAGFKSAASGIGHGLLATGGVIGKGLIGISKAGIAVGTAAAAGLSAAGTIGVKTAAEMEQAEISFTTMLGSGEKAKAFLQDLSKFAAKTPFDLPGLQTAASSLVSAGIDANKVVPIMTSLGNATSGMGTGAEGIKRATTALQQMNAAGKISGEDLNQLRDAGIPVFDLLTAATGKTTAQIAEMANKGKLGKKELEQLMTALESGKGLEKFNGLMDAQSQSMTGLLSTFKDTFSVGMAEAVQPLIPLLKDGLGGATKFLTDTLLPKAKVLFTELTGGIYAFTAAWMANDGDITSSGFPGFMEQAAYSIRQAWEWAQKLDFSSVSGFFESLGASSSGSGEALASIGTSLTTLLPAIGELGKAGAQVGEGGASLLATILATIADNMHIVVAAIPFLVGGFAAWKVAQMALTFVQQFAIPIQVLLNVTRIAAALAEKNAAKATLASARATGTATVADNASLFSKIRHTAAVAAGTVAHKVGAAAKWLYTKATGQATAAENASFFSKIRHNIAVGASAAVHKVAAAAKWLYARATGQAAAAQVAENAATQMSAGAHIRAAAAVVGHRIAVVAQGVAAKAAAAGQWLLNAAMSANPIMIVVLALAALTAATVWFLTQTEVGKKVVENVWGFIQSTIKGVGDWFNNTLVPALQQAIGWIGSAFQWLWKAVIEPVFNFIGTVLGGFWSLAKFIFEALVALITKVIAPAFVWLYENVVKPIFDGIGSAIKWVWEHLIQPVFKAVVWYLENVLGPAMDWLWKNVVKPVFDGIGAAIKWVWDYVIKPVFDRMSDVIQKDVPKAFEKGVEFVKSAWEGLQEIVKSPIRFVVNTVLNDGLIGAMNGVADFLGIKKLPRIALPPGFAAGGWTGPGSKYQPAGIVHADEHVIRKESRQQMERTAPGLLDHINRYGSVAGYAGGGRVAPLKQLMVTQGYNRIHKGIDYAAGVGTPVFATQDGVVSHSGPGARAPGVWGGNEVHVLGGGLETWFAHLSQIAVRRGEQVRAGQVIARSGNTGISSGPHLHFGVFRGGWPNDMDPSAYLGGAGAPNGAGWNPIAGIIDGLMGAFKKAFPAGGMMLDLIGGIGKKILTGAADYITGLFNGSTDRKGRAAGATVFDGGGWLENTGGPQLIEHNRRRPDAVLSAPQWDTMVRIADGAAQGTHIEFNGPVYGNPQHIVDEMEARKRRAATFSNLASITVGG